MTSATPPNVDLAKVNALIDQRTAQARPVLAVAILVAAISLIASTILTLRLSDANRSLEERTAELQEKNAKIESYKNQVAQMARAIDVLNQQLKNPNLTTAKKEELAAESAKISDAIPGSGAVKFSDPSLQPIASDQLLTLGSSTGWDIDSFWCAGPNQASNYASARQAAIALAQPASTNKIVAPGVRFGQIRLRPASPANATSWKGVGPVMVKDNDGSEDQVASVVAQYLASQNFAIPPAHATAGNNTRWYLSIFACK